MKNEKNARSYVLRLVLSAMFLAIGLYLPFLTGQIQQIGNMLCPMHLPVLLCGLICGWQYGGAVGFVLPLLRHMLFSMPPMPNAVAMALELATYGIVAGAVYARFRRQSLAVLYVSLISAMIAGRLVWGAAMLAITGIGGTAFSWQMFLSGAVLTAVPGIILQLALIPAVMAALDRIGAVRFRREPEPA